MQLEGAQMGLESPECQFLKNANLFKYHGGPGASLLHLDGISDAELCRHLL